MESYFMYLFSFQICIKYQFHKIDPYDWFCSPGWHMKMYLQDSERSCDTDTWSNDWKYFYKLLYKLLEKKCVRDR